MTHAEFSIMRAAARAFRVSRQHIIVLLFQLVLCRHLSLHSRSHAPPVFSLLVRCNIFFLMFLLQCMTRELSYMIVIQSYCLRIAETTTIILSTPRFLPRYRDVGIRVVVSATLGTCTNEDGMSAHLSSEPVEVLCAIRLRTTGSTIFVPISTAFLSVCVPRPTGEIYMAQVQIRDIYVRCQSYTLDVSPKLYHTWQLHASGPSYYCTIIVR